MGIQSMHNVSIVFADLDKAVAFFVDLGMTELGSSVNEGDWVDQCCGVRGTRSRITMLQTPDGHGRLELAQYLEPGVEPGLGALPANTLGMHRVCFEVDDIDAALEVAAEHGCAPLDRVAQYEDVYRMCYLRGPEGIIVMLGEPLKAGAAEAVVPR